MDTREIRSSAILLLAALVWGLAFVAQRIGMEHVGPFVFNALRFVLGSLTVLPVWYLTCRKGANIPDSPPHDLRELLVGGCQAGTLLFAGVTLQQIGLVYTTAGKAGFITGLYVVLVPLIGLVFRHRVGTGGWIGAFLATVGLYMLSVREGFRIETGDALVLAGAFFWAFHVLLIARLARRVNVVSLALVQFSFCAVLSSCCALSLEEISIEGIRAAAIPILYGGVLSVGAGFTLQVVGQKHARPNVAAIILSLEAVVAALGGWVILNEILPLRGVAGCALMLAGVMISQLVRPPDP